MSLTQLTIVACSILHGGVCNEFEYSYDASQVSVWMCAVKGQHRIAEWQKTHPNWKVSKYRCRPYVQEAKA